MEKILCNKIAIVVDKISMVSPYILTSVDLHFSKVQVLHKNLSIALG